MRIVAALGGSSLLGCGDSPEASLSRRHIEDAAGVLATIARGNQLIVTHGSGPQAGTPSLQAAFAGGDSYPLDVGGAETAGRIGYLLQQALGNHMPDRDVVTLLTEVLVDGEDAGLAIPSKSIGPVLPMELAWSLARERGWHLSHAGAGYRRIVPSPEPREIVQIEAIIRLASAGAIVICAGGGGVPSMLECQTGKRQGIEAVIDDDLSAALLAIEARADLLMLLTDVDAVYRDWGTDVARPMRAATTDVLRGLTFGWGSMAPKVEAACRFVEATGRLAAIGSLGNAVGILNGSSGTLISPSRHAAEPDGLAAAGSPALLGA
jgi:carbamate kinase